MVFNQRWYFSLGVAIPALTSILLIGLLNVIFKIDVNTNLFNTGITPGIILAIANGFLTWAIFKKKV